MMAKGIGVYLRKAFTLVLFMVVSAFALFFAYGYQYDFKKKDIQKTSIIDISAKESDVKVMLEGQEVANQLPFQVKGVLPGKYVVEVMKAGFEMWQRQVDVAEDIVTIVNDVILVPVDLQKLIRPLVTFSQKNARYFYGMDYIVELQPGEKSLRVISLYGNATVKDEEIELFKSGIDRIEPLDGDDFLIYFNDGGTAWVSFVNKRFVFFNLPKGADSIRVSAERDYLYYLLDRNLYGVPLVEVDKLQETPDQFMIVSDVSAYVSTLNGDLYYLSSGKPYKADYKGNGALHVETFQGDFINIGYKPGHDYGALILRDKDQKRHLSIIDPTGNIRILENDLKGEPFFNDNDEVIYASDSGTVYFLDNTSAGKKIVSKQSGDFTLLGWFTNEGHFIQREGNKVIMNDIYNSNRYTLIEDASGMDKIFVSGKSLFFLKENTLNVLSWLDG